MHKFGRNFLEEKAARQAADRAEGQKLARCDVKEQDAFSLLAQNVSLATGMPGAPEALLVTVYDDFADELLEDGDDEVLVACTHAPGIYWKLGLESNNKAIWKREEPPFAGLEPLIWHYIDAK